MATAQIHLATPETTNFYFERFGTTEDGAEAALTVLHKQGRQCHPRLDWQVQDGDPATRAARLVHGGRDGKRIIGGNRPQART